MHLLVFRRLCRRASRLVVDKVPNPMSAIDSALAKPSGIGSNTVSTAAFASAFDREARLARWDITLELFNSPSPSTRFANVRAARTRSLRPPRQHRLSGTPRSIHRASPTLRIPTNRTLAHRVAKRLAGLEGRDCRRGDSNALACTRISSRPCRPALRRERAEPRDGDRFSSLKGVLDDLKHRIDRFVRLGFRQRNTVCDMSHDIGLLHFSTPLKQRWVTRPHRRYATCQAQPHRSPQHSRVP